MDFEEKNRKRDRKLRRLMLNALVFASKHAPAKQIAALTLVEHVNGFVTDSQQVEDDAHGIDLIRYLVSHGYAEERVVNLRKGEQFGLRHLVVTITARGRDLWEENIPADPGIDDDRIEV